MSIPPTLFPSLLRTSFPRSPAPRWARCRRAFSASAAQAERTPVGRIVPKRIAVEIPSGYGSPSIWRPIFFATGLSLAAYGAAAIYTNRDTDAWTEKLGRGSWWRRGSDQPDDDEIQRAKSLALAKKMQSTLDSLPSTLSFLPPSLLTPIMRIYITTSESLLITPPSQLTCLAIIGVNTLVFLAWKLPSARMFMNRYFMHWPVGPFASSVTLATSVFSHQSLMHLGFNSLALYSFGSAAYNYLAHPPPTSSSPLASSTTAPHFLAFFLTAGLFASLASHLSTNLIRLPRLLRNLSAPGRVSSPASLAAQGGVLPSLGASGAIYGMLVLTGLAYPEAKVSLIFLPMFPISIGYGMLGMVGVDVAGLLLGWKMFDHVAHLAGATFGLIYWKWGNGWWDYVRRGMGGKEVVVGI